MPRNRKNTRRRYHKKFNKKKIAKILGISVKELTFNGACVTNLSEDDKSEETQQDENKSAQR